MTRPLYYPEHDKNQTNIVPVDESDFRAVGYPPGLKVPSGDHNGKFNSLGAWVVELDTGRLANYDWLDVTGTQKLSVSALAYTVGQSVLTGAAVLTRGTYLIEGVRVETDAAWLNPVPNPGAASGDPLLFVAATRPGRIWVYADNTGSVRFESVGVGVADAPAAGEQALVGVDIDAAGLITDGAVDPTTQPMPVRAIDIVAPLTVVGTGTMLSVTGGSITGDAAGYFSSSLGPALEAVATSGDPALKVSNTTGPSALQATAANPTTGAIEAFGTTGRALYCLSTAAEPAAQIEHSGAGAGVSIETTGAGLGLRVDTTGGSGSAVEAYAAGAVDVVYSETTTGSAFRAEVTSTGIGVEAVAGPAAASLAVQGTAQHIDGTAIQGITAGGASELAIGVTGIGLGDGAGIAGNTSTGDGYAAILFADTTSPTRAALWLVPQDADPSMADQGAVLFNDARGPTGKLRTFTTQWESVHSSAKGWLRQWGSVAAGGPIAGGSGNLSTWQITPEQVGDVLVTATGSIVSNIDSASATIQLLDVTGGGSFVIASQVERAIDTDGVAPNQRSFVIRGVRTLPDTVTRTFAVFITANTGTVVYSNVVCSGEGVQ